VLKFSAVQTGSAADLKVRIRATDMPNDESSWIDLLNGSGVYMTRDATTGLFVLNSLNYPLENGCISARSPLPLVMRTAFPT